MTDDHGNHPDPDLDGVARRLATFGEAPIDPGLSARCQARLRASRGRGLPGARSAAIVAAAIAGFMAGSVGLAAADNLPAPAQELAHDALSTVGVHVPPGHDRYDDPAVCPGGPYRNHGAYVRSHTDDPNAGASPCGKPVRSVVKGEGPDADTDESDGDAGPPSAPHGKAKKGDKGKGHGRDHGSHGNKGDRHDDGEADGDGTRAPDVTPSTPPTTTAAAPTTIASLTTVATTSPTTVAPTTSTLPATTEP